MDKAITENFSKKRGRRASSMSQVIAGLYLDDGKRSQNNKGWMVHALGALGYKPGQPSAYAWLLETTPAGRWKRGTLLSEIGRLGNPEMIREIAAQLCKQRPKVKDGVIMARGWRQSLQGRKPAAPDCIALTNEIIASINSYVTRYPEVTKQFILTALENATNAAQED